MFTSPFQFPKPVTSLLKVLAAFCDSNRIGFTRNVRINSKMDLNLCHMGQNKDKLIYDSGKVSKWQ